MAMTFEELRKLGIKKESDTEAFYRHWSGKLADPGARVLLSELADEEAKHRIFFEKLTKSQFTAGPAPAVLDLHIGDYLVAKRISDDSSTQDVLIAAIHRETSAIRFFTYLAGHPSELQATFQHLASEEKKHKLRLETFYDDHILVED